MKVALIISTNNYCAAILLFLFGRGVGVTLILCQYSYLPSKTITITISIKKNIFRPKEFHNDPISRPGPVQNGPLIYF